MNKGDKIYKDTLKTSIEPNCQSEMASSIQCDTRIEYRATDQTETDRQKVVQGNVWN